MNRVLLNLTRMQLKSCINMYYMHCEAQTIYEMVGPKKTVDTKGASYHVLGRCMGEKKGWLSEMRLFSRRSISSLRNSPERRPLRLVSG